MIHWLTQHKFIFGTLLLFVVTFFLGVWLLNGTTFADPDSFYHIKIAERIASGEVITEFNWLPFTVLQDYYADQHFLYHVYLVPFVTFLDPFEGAKLATIYLAAIFLVIFVWTLKVMKIRFPLLYGFVLLTLTPFIFRLFLVKAPAFSLILLFVGMTLAWRKNWISVGVIAFVYSWSYGGFILLPLVILWMTLVRLLSQYIKERHYLLKKNPPLHISWPKYLRTFMYRKEIRVLFASFIGVIIGLVVHPFFPNILQYVNDQLIQIGIVNYKDIIGVGNEWYPFDVGHLITNNILLSVGVLLSFLGAILYGERLSMRTLFLFPLFLGSLLFTLKSSRYIEYYVPFALIFVSSAMSDYSEGIIKKKIISGLKKITVWYWIPWVVLGLFIASSLAYIIPRDMRTIHNDLSGGTEYYKSKNASEWLADHSSKGDVVLHSDWDEFPYLFYWNDVNSYIVGLDPTFLYRASEEDYWAWVNITLGKTQEGIAQIAHDQFNAKYIMIETGHDVMLQNVNKDERLEVVYNGEDAIIFLVH